MGNFLTSYLPFSKHEAPSNVIFPFGTNEKLTIIADKFRLDSKDLIEFHKTFRKMDSQGTGYINLDNLYSLIQEELSSVISPYLERLFLLIEKENQDKITFIEWLPPTAVFCLYTSEKIIEFVFNMIDSDQDSHISKKDMIKFLTIERFNKKIFPYNHVKAIELLDLPRSDKISLEQFKRVHQNALFLCFPAFKLQERLRTRVLGEIFWENLYKKIHEIESEENKKKQRNKMQEDKKKKLLQKTEKNTKKFEEKMKGFTLNQGFFKGKKNLKIRNPRRRASDSKFEIKHIPDLIEIPARKRNSDVYIKAPMNIQVEKKEKKLDKSNRQTTLESNHMFDEGLTKNHITSQKFGVLSFKK